MNMLAQRGEQLSGLILQRSLNVTPVCFTLLATLVPCYLAHRDLFDLCQFFSFQYLQ